VPTVSVGTSGRAGRSPCPPRPLLPDRWRRLAHSDRTLRAVYRFLRETARTAQAHAEQQLTDLVGELGERFQATSAWLFVRETDDVLRARITRNTRRRHLDLGLDDRGIVPYVARVRHGYYSNNVHEDPWYRQESEETQSELAVPIITRDDRLLGVLNLESRMPGAFTSAHVEELQAAAGDLVPHLLVLAALRRRDEAWCPWHPEVHGWDLAQILNAFCYVVAASRDGDATTCTIWYADWPKEEFLVYATTGYDNEYISARTLPAHSFTGRVAQGPPGAVVASTPHDPDFVRRDKAEVMGLTRLFAAPVYTPAPPTPLPLSPGGSGVGGEGADRAVATLNLYLFDDQSQDAFPPAATLAHLAEIVGDLFAGYNTQRQELAAAYLHQKLYARPRSSEDAFETIKEVLTQLLQADACTIFARQRDGRRLYCVATTGLEGAGTDGAAVYDLDQDGGYTTYLARHPGQCIRKSDVQRPDEKGLPADFPAVPLNKHREKIGRSDADHPRFLGLAVDVRGDVLGVFRVMRSSQSRPFTRCEERLLLRLADVCKKVFLDWRSARPAEEPPTAVPGPGHAAAPAAVARSGTLPVKSTQPNVVAAVARFVRPVPNLSSPRTLIDELLQDMVVIFRDQHVYQASVLVRHKHAPTSPFRIYAYHSQHHRTPPTDAPYAPQSVHAGSLPWEAVLARRRAVTFTRPHAPGIASGIRMPLVAWTGHNLFEGVLSLDFANPVAWTGDEVEILFHATRKLAAILGVTDHPGVADHVISPECFTSMSPRTVLDQFVSFPTEKLGADWAELLLKHADRLQPVGQSGPRPADLPHVWRPLTAQEDEDAAGFGVKAAGDRRTCAIPLRLGSFDAGELRCRLGRPDFERLRWQVVGVLAGLWCSLTFGMQRFWDVTFERHEVRPGTHVWGERLRWRPLEFAAGQGPPAKEAPSLVTYLS
jgi:GAF domain-containing protein